MTIPNCKDCKHFKKTNGSVTFSLVLTEYHDPVTFYGDGKMWVMAAAFRMSGDCGPEGKYFDREGQ